MLSRLTVAVAEDHAIFRRQLVVALERDPDVEVVAEAADLGGLASRLGQRPSVVVADSSAPGQGTVASLARRDAPLGPPVVAMVGPGGDPAAALVAGASAVLAKDLLIRHGADLLRLAAVGVPVLDAPAGRALLELARHLAVPLSGHQEQVLHQLAAGRDVAPLAGWFARQPSDTHLALTATIMDVRAVAVGARRTRPLAGSDGPPRSRQ